MPYEIRTVSPIVSDRRQVMARFPFANVGKGQGFFVPNIDNMPPAEDKKNASTLRNMQTHCSYQNRKKKNVEAGVVFRAALYPTDHCWIQVWRES